jgi:MOSC domain-containing protein YiiM
MKVVGVCIGEKKVVNWNGKDVETGIFKYPVNEIELNFEAVVGDAIVNRKYHGGIEQAVYAYGENHYEFWKEKYPNADFDFGMFGENLTITDLDETKIHTGEQYKLGTAIIEVTKPRDPCIKLGVRFGTQDILKPFWNSTKCGVYFKVLQKGKIKAGDELMLLKKSEHKPTIAEMYNENRIKKGQ